MRVLRHLLLSRAALQRRFPAPALTAIEAAIEASEKLHRAELRVAIEVALDARALWRLKAARERALEVFAELEVWNTVESNGVLIYVLLAERDVEIVADRGFDGRVTQQEWREVCTLIEQEFKHKRWRDGVLRGIEAATALAAREFPSTGQDRNEQLDRPVLL